jgi:hypothetical protein
MFETDARQEVPMPAQNRSLTIAGWVIHGLVSAGLTMSAVMKFQFPEEMAKQWMGHFAWPAGLATPIAVVELACLVIFLFPRTAILGAILLTGYLGGAVATHVRVEDGEWFPPVIMGVMIWGGLWLRDPRVRAIAPWMPALAGESGSRGTPPPIPTSATLPSSG